MILFAVFLTIHSLSIKPSHTKAEHKLVENFAHRTQDRLNSVFHIENSFEMD